MHIFSGYLCHVHWSAVYGLKRVTWNSVGSVERMSDIFVIVDEVVVYVNNDCSTPGPTREE